jgi:hypothetical protein
MFGTFMCLNCILKCVQMYYCGDGTCGVPKHVAELITREEYIFVHINPLKTKRRLLYLKTQSVPRCKHFSSRL